MTIILLTFLLLTPSQITEPPKYITVKPINSNTALISYPDGTEIKIDVNALKETE